MPDTADTLRSYLLTDQEARVVYSVMDFAIPELVKAGANSDAEIHAAIALRERFHVEDDRDVCPDCGGSGKSNPLPPLRSGPPPCTTCNGTGKAKDTP